VCQNSPGNTDKGQCCSHITHAHCSHDRNCCPAPPAHQAQMGILQESSLARVHQGHKHTLAPLMHPMVMCTSWRPRMPSSSVSHTAHDHCSCSGRPAARMRIQCNQGSTGTAQTCGHTCPCQHTPHAYVRHCSRPVCRPRQYAWGTCAQNSRVVSTQHHRCLGACSRCTCRSCDTLHVCCSCLGNMLHSLRQKAAGWCRHKSVPCATCWSQWEKPCRDCSNPRSRLFQHRSASHQKAGSERL